MKANELIEQNNQKRELLTEENEMYYSKLLMYIRTKLSLSEQQSEEVLMEMLDHLLEGQDEGKSAREIFGDDPKGYADEIIEQLPTEEKRDMVKFLGQLSFNLMGWFLVIRGFTLLLFSIFVDVSDTVYILPTIIILGLIALSVSFGVKVILGLIHQSLFNEKSSEKKDMLKAGLYGAGSFAIILAANYFIREFGPSFEFPWTASLGSGGMLLLISWLMKRKVL
ncbi:DUF1129 family protein [Paenisporosarcina indica]|uniref:DUF1129 family protein n=1 Tax=Paenisporosarcina indica TaxID=650093 RepID=UPI00094FCF47|nr:DUF1129 family protein [Paenisporosarcina indica]